MRVISRLLALLLALPLAALAADAGLIKVAKGDVRIERAGALIKAEVGTAVQENDVLVTGADGTAGITFDDNSLLSIGPNSAFAINAYRFDTTTHAGAFDATLRKGRLAGVSGKMVKQSPESMKIRTPSSVMGVRGTEFLVEVGEPADAR